MAFRYAKGWFQVAFERDLAAELTPACIGTRRLILVRTEGAVRAFDADCPHRGAHLGLGGRLIDGAIYCPFHNYRIRLGCQGQRGFAVREYDLLLAGGMVFVRLSEGQDNGWRGYLEHLVDDHHMINGFEMSIRAPAETVIENAFDRHHFQAVHGIRTGEFEVRAGAAGELIVESLFFVPMVRDGGSAIMPTPYRAVVISPALAMVQLRGAMPYTVITGATATADGGCAIRLTLALPRSHFPEGPPRTFYEPLLAHSRRGLEEDRVIWENLSPSVVPSWTAEDHASLSFFQFCETFADG